MRFGLSGKNILHSVGIVGAFAIISVLALAKIAAAQTFTSMDTPLDIPIGAPGATSGTTTSTITVVGAGSIQDVNLVMDFNHTFFSDLDVDITSPSGTTVRLFEDEGGAGDPTGTYTFDDEAAVAFSGQTPGGTFSPPGALAAFDGENAEGDWILTVIDDAGGDTGTLNFWQLVFILGALDNFLDDQQISLSPFIMNQSTGDLISGVSGNVSNTFNGSSFALSASDSSFNLQSRSIAQQKLVRAAYKKLQQIRASGTAVPLSDRLATGTDGLSANATYGADASLEEAAQVANSPLNFWARGTFGDYDGDNASFDGQIANINGGIDYRLADDLLVGVLLGYGDADFDTVTNGVAGTFDSSGFTVGGYIGWQVAPDVTFDALFAYTDLEYDNTSGAVVGSFDADRWTFAANLQSRMEYGDITILPTLNFHYAMEDQDAYVDSAAILQPARDIDAGRLAVGPVIQFAPIDTSIGSAQGWIGVKGEYDFSDQNAVLNTTLPDFGDTFSGRVQVGANFIGDNGATLGFQVDVSGLGASEFDGVSGSVEFRLPF